MMKQITLAALTALFAAAGVGMASAEGSISSAESDLGSSAQLQAEYAATHRGAYAMHPRGSTDVYVPANHRRHITVTRHGK